MGQYYQLKPIKLGCEVRGINLKTENRPEGMYNFFELSLF